MDQRTDQFLSTAHWPKWWRGNHVGFFCAYNAGRITYRKGVTADSERMSASGVFYIGGGLRWRSERMELK